MSSPKPPPPDPTGLGQSLTDLLGPPVRKMTKTGSVSLTWFMPKRDWLQTRHRNDAGQLVGRDRMVLVFRHINAANEHPTGPAARDIRKHLWDYTYTRQDIADLDPALLEPWEKADLAAGRNYSYPGFRGMRLTVVLAHRTAPEPRNAPKAKHPDHQHAQYRDLLAGVEWGLGRGLAPHLYRWHKRRNRGVVVWDFDNRGRGHPIDQGLETILATIKKVGEGLPYGAARVSRVREKGPSGRGNRSAAVVQAEARVYLYAPVEAGAVDYRPAETIPEDFYSM